MPTIRQAVAGVRDASGQEVQDILAVLLREGYTGEEDASGSFLQLDVGDLAAMLSMKCRNIIKTAQAASKSAAPVLPENFVNSSSLLKAWENASKLHLVPHTWVAADARVRDNFLHWWNQHGPELRQQRFTTIPCGKEPDDECYSAGANIYTRIYQFMLEKALGATQRNANVNRFINKGLPGDQHAGQPDVCWGPAVYSDVSTIDAHWAVHGSVVVEYKTRQEDLRHARAQIIDRAGTMRKKRNLAKLTLSGAASTGVVLQSVLVVVDGGAEACSMFYTTPLPLVASASSSSTTNTGKQELHVDTGSQAFQELTFHVWHADNQHLQANAKQSLKLQPGDVVTLGSHTESRRNSSNSDSSSSNSVVGMRWCQDIAPLSCVISGTLAPVHGSRAVYAAVVAGGEYDGASVVLKLGATPEHQRRALFLGEPWEAWFQVERELAARQGRNFRGVATLLAGGLVSAAPKQQLIGSCAAVFLVEGSSLVRPGQPLPRLSDLEAVALLTSGVQALCELQAAGIFYNDVHPRNIARRDASNPKQLPFYFYDLGLASSFEVQELYDALSAGQQMRAVCPDLPARFSPVWDLLFGSTAAISGSFLAPDADFESLLYTMVALLGFELPWASAAAAGDADAVLRIRVGVRRNVAALPGWDCYPPHLQSFAQAVLADPALAAPGDAQGWHAIQHAWLVKQTLHVS